MNIRTTDVIIKCVDLQTTIYSVAPLIIQSYTSYHSQMLAQS